MIITKCLIFYPLIWHDFLLFSIGVIYVRMLLNFFFNIQKLRSLNTRLVETIPHITSICVFFFFWEIFDFGELYRGKYFMSK